MHKFYLSLLVVFLAVLLMGADDCDNSEEKTALEKAQEELNVQANNKKKQVEEHVVLCIKYNQQAKELLEAHQVQTLEWPHYSGGIEDQNRQGYFDCYIQMEIQNRALDDKKIPRPRMPGVDKLPKPDQGNTINV